MSRKSRLVWQPTVVLAINSSTVVLDSVAVASRRIFWLWFTWQKLRVFRKWQTTGQQSSTWTIIESAYFVSVSSRLSTPISSINAFAFWELPSRKVPMILDNLPLSKYATTYWRKELSFRSTIPRHPLKMYSSNNLVRWWDEVALAMEGVLPQTNVASQFRWRSCS